ncbi:MAG: hypothetical protein QOJ03_826 [Frankiaceae bacterium]|nr:hypothetical protein [Frankiaceae bacterium]
MRTTIRGRLVRGNGVAYRLVVGKHRTQVVRIRRGTYVRKVPGRWSRLNHARAVVNPTKTLLAVLRGLIPTALTSVGGRSRIEGRLAPAAAKKAGIPTDNRPASVVVTLDRAARVTLLAVSTSTKAGTNSVTVTVRSTYRGFGHARHIVAPV